MCYPWRGTKGPRARTPECRGTPISPAPPGVRTHLGRGAEPSGKSGAGWRWAPGPHPSAVGARRERSLPRFPVFAVPADRGLAARVACVRRSCCVPCGGRLAPPPRRRSHGWGAAVDPSLLGVGDPVLALRGRDLSLGCGLWRERRSVVSRRVAGRVGARRRRRAFLRRRRARLSRRWGPCERGCERRASRASREPREGRRLSGRPSSAAWRRVRRPRCVWGLFRPRRRRRPPGRRVSCGEPPPHRVGCLAVRYPPLACALSPPVRRRRGLRSMTLPDPEVRARPSVVGRGVPPHVPRGEDRPRVVVVVDVSSSPSRFSPPRLRARARPGFFAASRSPPPPPLVRGRPPSVSPAKPVGAVCRLPPCRFPVSRPRPERVRVHPALSPALRLAAARVGGPAAAPHPLSSARPRPPAWNRGVVSRRGASRGSASVSRRLGGSRRVASPGSGHPPPSSRSSLPLVRPRLAVPCSLPAAVCVGGISGDIPVVPSGGRRPRFSSLSPPACGVFRPPRAPLARSLAPARLGLARRRAGLTSGRAGRPA